MLLVPLFQLPIAKIPHKNQIVLGLSVDLPDLASATRTYSAGCAFGWLSLLYFQVFDFLLAPKYPNIPSTAIIEGPLATSGSAVQV